MQKLCKTPGFGRIDKGWLKDLNKESFDDIVNQIKETAPLITNMMLSLRFISNIYLTSHLVSMKLLAVLIIMYRSAH